MRLHPTARTRSWKLRGGDNVTPFTLRKFEVYKVMSSMSDVSMDW